MKRRKPPVKSEARKKHERFLEKAGLLPSQIKERQSKRTKERFKLGFEGTAAEYYAGTSHASADIKGDAQTGTDRSIMANLHKEPEHVRREIMRKAAMCEPSYSKGSVQYCPNNIRMYGVK